MHGTATTRALRGMRPNTRRGRDDRDSNLRYTTTRRYPPRSVQAIVRVCQGSENSRCCTHTSDHDGVSSKRGAVTSGDGFRGIPHHRQLRSANSAYPDFCPIAALTSSYHLCQYSTGLWRYCRLESRWRQWSFLGSRVKKEMTFSRI